MNQPIVVDVAGARVGGAARLAGELRRYLSRTGRHDVKIIGTGQTLNPAWLIQREVATPGGGCRIALSNVGFVSPGGKRWTVLRNALHFLTDEEEAVLGSTRTAGDRWKTRMVRVTARRADVLVTPSTSMAERVTTVMPHLQTRIVVRPHPVSPGVTPPSSRPPAILCPVLFAPYKHMPARIAEWLEAVKRQLDPDLRLIITAEPCELPADLAHHSQVEVAGRLPHSKIRHLWDRCRAIYFPPTLESFGFPLAEARVNGYPVIAADTAHNREIAGPALCGFTVGDAVSLCHATRTALSKNITPDPGPFDSDSYFDWLLGGAR